MPDYDLEDPSHDENDDEYQRLIAEGRFNEALGIDMPDSGALVDDWSR